MKRYRKRTLRLGCAVALLTVVASGAVFICAEGVPPTNEQILLAEKALAFQETFLGPEHPARASALNNLAGLYDAIGDYAKALRLCERALRIREKVLGAEHPDTATSLNNVGQLCQVLGDLAKAESLFERAWQVTQKISGPEHPDTALSLNNLASLYDAMGEKGKAEPLFERALAINEKALGPEHPRTATALNNLALFHDEMGNYAKAKPLYERSLKITEKMLGRDHPEAAICLNNLAGLYHSLGEDSRAEELHQRALRIRERALGPEHPETAASRNALALSYQTTGDYARAEPLYVEALRVSEQRLGPDHPQTATILANLAVLNHAMARYADAEILLNRALKIREKTIAPDNPQMATVLNNLAGIHALRGDFAQARRLFEQTLRITEKVWGPEHRDTALALNNLAKICYDTGDFAAAEPLYARALRIRQKALGPEHPDTAGSLNDLAELYRAMGDYPQAEVLHTRALKIRDEKLGRGHPKLAESLNNLAGLSAAVGDYAKAEARYTQALDITERRLGPEHPATAANLNNLAALFEAKGDLARAETLYERAWKIREKSLGPEHPDTAGSLNNLAVLFERMGHYQRAEGLHKEALEIKEKALGPDHWHTASSLNNLGGLYLAMGEDAKAEPLLRRGLEIMQKHTDQAATIQSQRQQLMMSGQVRASLHAWLSLAPRVGIASAEMLGRCLVNKGQVAVRQESLRRLRAALTVAGDAEGLAIFTGLEQTYRQLAALANASFETGPKNDRRRKGLEELTQQKEKLERELAARSALFRRGQSQPEPTLADSRQVLVQSPGAVLVDLEEYAHFGARSSDKTRPQEELRVLAFVLRWDREQVERIELGPVEPIQTALAAWWRVLGAGEAGAAAGSKLRELVWTKLAPSVAGAEVVLISPDGVLSQMPWSALPGPAPGDYLLEEHSFAVVPVPRLLPRLMGTELEFGKMPPALMLVGDVDYGEDSGTISTAGARSAVKLAGGGVERSWSPLPATRDEVRSVADSFRNGIDAGVVEQLTRERATEEAFRQAAGRHRYLHMATHGYFAYQGLQDQLRISGRGTDEMGMFARQDIGAWNPGLQSGLVLAGANLGPRIGEDDGILTAFEVQGLALDKVELAVLSACETSLGQNARGEGLLGLQRAFQLAGARTTVGTLWKVADRETQQVMAEFYRRLWREKQGKLQALRGAQLWMLRQKKEARTTAPDRGVRPAESASTPSAKSSPYYWAAFVLSGDWR